jgi:hypothetical protein
LCGATVAEVEQLAIEASGVDARGFPTGVEVAWQLLRGHEAAVEVGGSAASALERSQRVGESVKLFAAAGVRGVTGHDLVPAGVVDPWRQVAAGIERRDQNTILALGWLSGNPIGRVRS